MLVFKSISAHIILAPLPYSPLSAPAACSLGGVRLMVGLVAGPPPLRVFLMRGLWWRSEEWRSSQQWRQ